MKLTIAIATYNRNTMLKNLLMSICALTRRHNIELLIVNDGGSGGKIINSFCELLKQDGTNVRFIDRSENLNIYRTRYQLLSEATGDYFMFIDDDDFLDIITIHEWLNKGEFEDVDAWIFDVTTFMHNQKNPSAALYKRHNSEKDKVQFSLNGVIFNLNKLRVNLPKLKENIDKLENHNQNIGEDIFCSYWLTGGNRNPNIIPKFDPLTIINYDKSNQHMFFTDRSTNYLPGLGSMRMYLKNK